MTKFRGLTYRRVATGFITCENFATCKRAFSKSRHKEGYADGMGHLHWTGFDNHMTTAGLHKLLVMIASVRLNHSGRRLPRWQKIWEREVWAYREARERYHIRIPRALTMSARNEARHWARKERPSARSLNFAAYQWFTSRRGGN